MVSEAMQFTIEMLRGGSPLAGATLEERRATMEEIMGATPPPDGTTLEDVDADGVPCRWVGAPGIGSDTAVLYLHGGAYVLGSLTTHTGLASRLSAAADCPVLLVDYRLAPEHPFPAAVEDARRAFAWLVDQGLAPDRLGVAGDSAGGGLTLALLLSLRDAGLDLPAAAACLSAWTDLTLGDDVVARLGPDDPVLDADSLRADAAAYADGESLEHPLLSPRFADLAGLPPLLLHAAADELLVADSTTVAEKVTAAGGDVTLRVAPDVFHVWHATADVTPEGTMALAEVGGFLAARLGAADGA